MNLNKVFVLGNVTRDPEVRAIPNGQQVASFGLATNRFYTDAQGQKKQDTEFHNIVTFGKLADIASRYLNKGSLVLIEGRIKTRNWQNTQGVKQYRTEIIADAIQLGPRGMGGSNSPTGESRQYQKPASQEASQPKTETFNSVQDKEIPVIEENQMPPANFVSNEPPTQEENRDNEIDVKEIPF